MNVPSIPQMTQEEVAVIQTALSLTAGVMPVALSEACSVNLHAIALYTVIEEEEELPAGSKAKPKTIVTPVIFFKGSDDPLRLTDDQRDIFRPIWNNYQTLSHVVLAAAAEIAAAVDAGIDQAEANAEEVQQ